MNPMNTLKNPSDWEVVLHDRLSLFGHRNWIVIADAAYPAQSSSGIETLVAAENQLQVIQKVLNEIAACKHLRAKVYVDQEFDVVPESDAPGISQHRLQLDGAIPSSSLKRLPHEQIITKIDQCAQLFRILIVKTDLIIPYTSVFFELDCGYWNAEAEERLRQRIQEPSSI